MPAVDELIECIDSSRTMNRLDYFGSCDGFLGTLEKIVKRESIEASSLAVVPLLLL